MKDVRLQHECKMHLIKDSLYKEYENGTGKRKSLADLSDEELNQIEYQAATGQIIDQEG